MWVQIPASPKKTRWKDGPLDGRKSNKKNKGTQIGKATPKKNYLPHSFKI